ncbi:hypothetical protein, partial [Bacillus aquiflavi]|uniref:hypothetical protein n=1 Tax=Bacillus aquiflavi TaxID=2672567 RepID=UPI001C555796
WTEHLCLALVLLAKNNTGLFTEYSVLIYATLMNLIIFKKVYLSHARSSFPIHFWITFRTSFGYIFGGYIHSFKVVVNIR